MPLIDLRTEDDVVAKGYQEWIHQLVSNYSIDGLRIDTVMEVNNDFWQDFESAAGVFMIGEVAYGDPVDYICQYQNYLPGVLNYGTRVHLPNYASLLTLTRLPVIILWSQHSPAQQAALTASLMLSTPSRAAAKIQAC